jgi:dTDP-4-amino-4,6-dideoxygalactose transaminase
MDPGALEDHLRNTAESRRRREPLRDIRGAQRDFGPVPEHGAALVEDAAESLGYAVIAGATRGRSETTASIPSTATRSSRRRGGMVVLRRWRADWKIKFWATQARDPRAALTTRELGYNYRMSNVLAGIGRGQLKVLGRRVEQKRAIYAFLQEGAQRPGRRSALCPTTRGTRRTVG